MKKDTPGLVGFILKPSAIRQEVIAYFEQHLQAHSFHILGVAEKKLTEPEVDAIHCVVGPWKCNEQEYKQYMTSGITLGYLVRHDSLCGDELFSFCYSLRGASVEAHMCSEASLRKRLHEQLSTLGYKSLSPVENHVHVTDSEKELLAFLYAYFPEKEG